MHNIVHVEIPTTDLARAKAFYGKIFGWKFVDFDTTYALFTPAKKGVGGGIYKVDVIPAQSPVRAYVLVKDVDVTLRQVTAGGGTVVKARDEVPGMGWYAAFKDPLSAEVWIWQTKPRRPRTQAKRRKARRR